MTDNPLSGKVGLDTSEFKTAIAGLNRELKVLESGFGASASALGDWANTASGLEMRIKTLTSEIDVQRQKVGLLTDQYNKVAAEKGATSKAAQDLQIKLNKETETLNQMQTELSSSEAGLKTLGNESGQAADDIKNLDDKSTKTASSLHGFETALSAVGTAAKVTAGLIAGLATAAAGAAIGLGKLVLDSAEYGDNLTDMSAKTGISTTRLQELKYAGKIVGTELETMTGSLSKLTRSMAAASQGGEAAKAFETLGVSVKDSNGMLLNSETTFGSVIDALGKVENPTQRDALAMQIFGKSALELNPLIKAGGAELAKLSEEAHKMGAVMSGEDVAAAGEFQDQLDGLKMGLQGTAMTIGAAFIPAFSAVATQAGGYMKDFAAIISSSGGDVDKMASGVSGLATKIVQDITAQLPQLMAAGLGIVQGILSAITANLPVILPAAVAILTSLVRFLVANLPPLMQAGLQIISTLGQAIMTALPQILPVVVQLLSSFVQFIVQNLPMVLDAALQIVLMLGTAILQNLPMLLQAGINILITLINGITQALPTMIPTIVSVLLELVNIIVMNLPLILTAGVALLQALLQGIIAALPILLTQMPLIVQAILDAIIISLPILGQAATQIILMLITGIAANLPLLGKSAGSIVTQLVSGVTALTAQIWNVGVSIVDGVWKGIQSRAATFKQQVMDFFINIIAAVKNTLGIKSPSTVFEGIGRNMVLGLSHGFGNEMRAFESDMAGITMALTSPTINTSGYTGSSVTQTSENYTFYAPVTIGTSSGDNLGLQLKTARY